jgi:hypothetical protein
MPPKTSTTTPATALIAPPTNAKDHPQKFKDWIASVKAYLAVHDPTKLFPSIYPEMIHFFDSKDKANWEKWLTGSEHAAHLHQVYHEPGPNASIKTRILLITTPTTNYIQQPDPADQKWHTWAIVEVKKQDTGYGKRLYIMDPNLPQQFRGADLSKIRFRDMEFNGAQRKFIKYIYDKAPSTTKVWVGRPGEAEPEKDRCVRDTCEWIDQLAKTEDKGWVQGEDDARFPDFKEANPSFG